MSRLISLIALASLGMTMSAASQDLRALARVDMDASRVTDNRGSTTLSLALTQAVPYRVQVFDAPNRIAVDFREVSFEADLSGLDMSDRIAELRAGTIRDGWSRLVMELSEPMLVENAGMQTDPQDGDAVITVTLAPTTQSDFSEHAKSTVTKLTAWQQEQLANTGETRRMVVVDPGHGGVDPGAQRAGVDEADLMLQFARELREQLLRTGRYDVIMTREDDSFVSLPQRVSLARAAGADVFISLHADALAEGRATGTTIYTLSDEASDEASANLAERQDRTDILAGVDLTAQDDQIATVLMDLARRETTPRTDRLAEALVDGLRNTLGKLHKRPRLEAGFSVLKAPDIPSVLIELGFMSSERDLDRLQDQVWRSQAAAGIVDALDLWALEDDAIAAGR
ncbi:N-acetylmuramoyl-L-alanine amidase [Litoreibacter halocynthiae]|uniref:N-acetylmuramoyl-L-alanine amidase n=1 Tax=Litoreibacter halocynthiae TaxID=1242689 RepID=A0A4R7LNG7_9RHOB|nr:N-acetylmuramoyl-L-alanine amidase [Litoreibacter halocynthiae]TDT77593.1 N-acetylmuramoyl-L-alanine amidase [Litoreibacter halocynthiae]